MIGHALYAPRPLRIAGCDVPGALIGMVVVAPDWRGVGVGGALIRDVEGAARSDGALVTQLAGALSYYSRFGYIDGYVDVTQRVPVSAIRPTTFREASIEDVDRLTEWSESHVPSGAVTPTRERWRWLLETGHPGRLIRTNERMIGFTTEIDRVVVGEDGYARIAVGGDVVVVYEAGARQPGALLDDLRAYAAELGASHLDVRLPSRHPVALAWERGDPTPNPEYLIKSIDTAAVFALIGPAIERRLVETEMATPIRLALGGFDVRLGGSVDVVRERFGGGSEREEGIYVPEIGFDSRSLGQGFSRRDGGKTGW